MSLILSSAGFDLDWDEHDEEYVIQSKDYENNATMFCTQSIYSAVDMLYALEYTPQLFPTPIRHRDYTP